MEDAIDDINRLIDAGNLNRAFGKITRNAEADRAAAEARLNNISAACEGINEKDADLTAEFRQLISASDKNAEAAAGAMHVDLPATNQIRFLLDKFATDLCGNAAKEQIINQLKQSGTGGQDGGN